MTTWLLADSKDNRIYDACVGNEYLGLSAPTLLKELGTRLGAILIFILASKMSALPASPPPFPSPLYPSPLSSIPPLS